VRARVGARRMRIMHAITLQIIVEVYEHIIYLLMSFFLELRLNSRWCIVAKFLSVGRFRTGSLLLTHLARSRPIASHRPALHRALLMRCTER
jgi:hypothetical protein